ncbi:hypothetical protein GCN78_27385 [Janthinobacterium rivuli]|uniref:hypothetical protein n=1 Tax=Janthinobacterium sp. FT68W TaxID=2654255 RepID=UPI00126497EE|nr:hypothetical protein [Janthinobacterium sp. FT68W]KAB8045539.1 hypothetical protein GCN78_27385 [Janthinobacterium sp. FT68W]
MKTAALLLAATLMTVGGAWVQAQSTTNVNQTGNHTNNPNDPGQQSDQSDKLDNKGKLIHDGKASKTRTDKRSRRGKPVATSDNPAASGAATSPPATPVAPAR